MAAGGDTLRGEAENQMLTGGAGNDDHAIIGGRLDGAIGVSGR